MHIIQLWVSSSKVNLSFVNKWRDEKNAAYLHSAVLFILTWKTEETLHGNTQERKENVMGYEYG